MRRLAVFLALFLASELVASSALAQATFTGLGTLPGTDESIATAISADGNWVVGYATTAGIPDKAWRWGAFTGMLAIGDLPGGADFSFATGVSSDGSVIVGVSESSLGREAFRWTEAGGMIALGDLPGGNFNSIAYAVSDDGNVAVGKGTSSSSTEAARWEGVGEADSPIGLDSLAYGISEDGSVIVGEIGNGPLAFRWTETEGLTTLGTLGGPSSRASAVSADGSTIVGQALLSASEAEPFHWTTATGMIGLGDLPGGTVNGNARDVSADGAVIVGQSNSGAGPPSHFEAFIWTANTQLLRVADVLKWRGVDTSDWVLQVARGVSDDGSG